MKFRDATWAAPAVARVRTLLTDALSDESGIIELHDQQLSGSASSCSTAQAAGFFAMLDESEITTALLQAVAGSQLPHGGFSIPYNQPVSAPPAWDIAELGAAAPALLVAARNGHRLAATVMLKGAEFTLSQERAKSGSFLKNASCQDQDVLNGNIYAAVTLACALELGPNTEYQRAIESVVEHSISRFGSPAEHWWSYSEHPEGAELVGKSLAYQATIVGYGRLLLGTLRGDLRHRWTKSLEDAQAAIRTALASPSPTEFEEPSWSRDWDQVSEIALGLVAITSDAPETDDLSRRMDILLERRTSTVPRHEDRTPTTSDLRFACNLASVVTILLNELEINPAAGLDLRQDWSAGITPEEYVRRFSDPASRPGPGRWSMTLSPEAESSIALPNRIEVRLPEHSTGWLQEDYEQQQSTLLWLHSLGFLPTMFEEPDGEERVAAALRTYVEFLGTAESQEVLSRMTSLDHAIAVRIRSLCTIFARCVARGVDVPRELLWLLARDASWGSVAANIKVNNHGMMLATAVLHYEALLATQHRESRSSIIGDALRKIIGASFDPVGVCRENTPSYQAFYLRFFRDLKDFLSWTEPSSSLLDVLDEIVTRGSETLSVMVWPDGTLPPIGDSGAEKSAISSVDGTIFSSESGFFVHKQDGRYLSLRCGHSSVVHKHVDDTSLTLRVGDVELLLDGGMHDYDWKNPLTAAVKSQRGHSGLFFERFDPVYPATFFRPGSTRVKSHMSMLDTSPGAIAIHCGYSIDDAFFAQRLVTFEEGHITLNDRFSSTTGEVAVQRFLVPADAAVTNEDSGLLVSRDGAWMRIRFDQGRPVTRYGGETVPVVRGWVSRSWGTIEECQVIELGPRIGSRTMDTEITYGEGPPDGT